MLFLGGTTTNPANYGQITSYLAGLGYDVLNLSYVNSTEITFPGNCPTNSYDCAEHARGMVAFGKNYAYPGTTGPLYAADSGTYPDVNLFNSIYFRAFCALAQLAQEDDQSGRGSYWGQYLANNANGFGTAGYTYTSGGSTVPVAPRNVLPDWSKIIIAGHSLGGAYAAFIGMHIPDGSAALRVVMLSSPQDYYTTPNSGTNRFSASWITLPTNTPMTRFWGLSGGDSEGAYGDQAILTGAT